MSEVVFILGAGASKECGAPLIANFLDVASSLHSTGKVGKQAKHFEKVFQAIGALQRVHSKSQLDLNNIESIFNAFEVANTIGKLPELGSEEIPELIESLKWVIVTTLQETIKFTVKNGGIITPEPYSLFTKLLRHITSEAYPTKTVSVITFNYDIVIDLALRNDRYKIDYCLDEGSSVDAISVLKLHGSLNWALSVSDNRIIPLQLDKYLSKYSVSSPSAKQCSIPIGNQLSEYFQTHEGIDVKDEPVIVPPSWNKAEHHQMVSKVWGRAAKEMGEAEYIFIMGYSLPETDAFFRYLYALGTVSDRPLKMIEIFNPDDSGETKARFEDLMGPGAMARFKYRHFIFSEAIHWIEKCFPSK